MSPGRVRTAFAKYILPIVGRDFGFKEGFRVLERVQPLDLTKEYALWVGCLLAAEFQSPEAAEFVLERLSDQDERRRYRTITLYSIAWSSLDLTAAGNWIRRQA